MTESVEEPRLPSPGERRRLREAADLAFEDVAAAVGVTVSTVRSWETGHTDPRGRLRAAYADFLTSLRAAQDTPPEAAGPAAGDAASPAAAGHTAAALRMAAGIRAFGTGGHGPQTRPQAPGPAPDGTTGHAPHPQASGHPDGDRQPPPADPEEGRTATRARAAGRARTEGAAAGVLEGPGALFDALYQYAAPALARQAYLLTGRRRLAEEAVERAFRQAWARWPEVAADPDPVGWVRAAVHAYVLSPWHRFRPLHKRPDKAPAAPADRILMDAMLALPPAHRRTVLLYDGVGLDIPDTAAETEASTPTAGNRLLYAHAFLADRIPELAAAPPEKQSVVLRERLGAVRPATPPQPRHVAAVRAAAELGARRWTRAVLGLTAVIAVATAYTTVTAPRQYEPPVAPGMSVSGVPPLSGPQRITNETRQLHDKLRGHPAHGPARLAPGLE
ncbi:helix-turn-helix domain-containing protein [Streptomyces sp. NPDC097981]|uniref:helix-turn-helix domain-containing protein n=1 Tax=Streptomyces sp. NPDC097981 TaxID=3155428 RepID=UPI00331D5D16